ncbi:MAG: hypothetical protein U0326_41755 [Polyangiales bacterium]
MSRVNVPQAVVTGRSQTLAPPVIHTAASLVAMYGEADRDTIAAFVWGVTATELFARGQRVSTARLVEDGVVMLGDVGDFLATATPAQRELLASINGRFLSAASSALLQAETLGGRLTRRKTSQRTQRQAIEVNTVKVMIAGRARRDIYRSNLIAQCGDDSAWKGRIDDACCAVATPMELADSLDSLAREGRSLFAHIASEKRECALDAAYLQKITKDATDLRDDAKATVGASSKAGLRKGDIDWWEGVSLWFLKSALDLFAKAHVVDPSIPKLSPGGLRSTLTPNQSRVRKSAAKPVTPPTPVHPIA